MSGQSYLPSLTTGSEEVITSTTSNGPTAKPQTTADKIQHELHLLSQEPEKEKKEDGERPEEGEDGAREDSVEVTVLCSAVSKPSTVPCPEDKDGRLQAESGGVPSEGTQQDSQQDQDRTKKAKWRESMPEGERWQDDDDDDVVMDEQEDARGGSLADDEDEEEDDDEEGSGKWISEKSALVFTPQVNIVSLSSKKAPQESRLGIENIPKKELQPEPASPAYYKPQLIEDDSDKFIYLNTCDHVCGENLRLALGIAAAALVFPLLVWGGYALLPFDVPVLDSAPLRLVYTLRCAFFATVPILLGVLVQGMARLRHRALSPLYQGRLESTEVEVHWHYVSESLTLFLFYFLQLAVMATYINQAMLKLVPLLTIVFAFGRLIYWVCLSLGSSVRGLGFGFSFLPILVMLGANLYYVCASVGQEAIFEVKPPTTTAPPKLRWWF